MTSALGGSCFGTSWCRPASVGHAVILCQRWRDGRAVTGASCAGTCQRRWAVAAMQSEQAVRIRRGPYGHFSHVALDLPTPEIETAEVEVRGPHHSAGARKRAPCGRSNASMRIPGWRGLTPALAPAFIQAPADMTDMNDVMGCNPVLEMNSEPGNSPFIY